jgi:hypothetical protein
MLRRWTGELAARPMVQQSQRRTKVLSGPVRGCELGTEVHNRQNHGVRLIRRGGAFDSLASFRSRQCHTPSISPEHRLLVGVTKFAERRCSVMLRLIRSLSSAGPISY